MKNYNSVENCQREKLQFCGELSMLGITILWRIVSENYNFGGNYNHKKLVRVLIEWRTIE